VEEFEELSIAQWPAFCEDFSRIHHGWLVRMWIVDTVTLESGMLDNGSMVVRDLALADISLERHEDGIDLLLMTRDPDAPTHSDHPIRQVETIKMETGGEDDAVGLMINTADMRTTVLRLRAAGDRTPPDSGDA